MGVNCRFLQGPLTNRETVRQVKQALVEGRQTDVDILNYRKDGIPFYNHFSILPIYSRDGRKVTHFLSIQKDVTHFQEIGLNPREWTPPEVATFLLRTGYEEYARQFIEYGITGEELLDITKWELETIFSMTARKAIYLVRVNIFAFYLIQLNEAKFTRDNIYSCDVSKNYAKESKALVNSELLLISRTEATR